MQRGRDSNPRYPHEYTRFPSVRLQPLGHLSVLISDPSAESECKGKYYCPPFQTFPENSRKSLGGDLSRQRNH